MKFKNVMTPFVAILVAALLLACASLGLSSVEKEYEAKALDIMLHNLLIGSGDFVEEEYTGEDANIRKVYKSDIGYVIETSTKGYVDEITMMVGVSNEGAVTGLVVKELSETYGLGANALSDTDFLHRFLNTTGNAEIGTNVDAISGATVTSKAVTRCVNSAVAFVTGADVSSSATSWGG